MCYFYWRFSLSLFYVALKIKEKGSFHEALKPLDAKFILALVNFTMLDLHVMHLAKTILWTSKTMSQIIQNSFHVNIDFGCAIDKEQFGINH